MQKKKQLLQHGGWALRVLKLTMEGDDEGERTVRRWSPFVLALGASGLHLNFFRDESRKRLSAPVVDLRKICEVRACPDEPPPEDEGVTSAGGGVFQLVVGAKYSKAYSLTQGAQLCGKV